MDVVLPSYSWQSFRGSPSCRPSHSLASFFLWVVPRQNADLLPSQTDEGQIQVGCLGAILVISFDRGCSCRCCCIQDSTRSLISTHRFRTGTPGSILVEDPSKEPWIRPWLGYSGWPRCFADYLNVLPLSRKPKLTRANHAVVIRAAKISASQVAGANRIHTMAEVPARRAIDGLSQPQESAEPQP